MKEQMTDEDMAKSKMVISDRIISIYVDKYFGERLSDITDKYSIKCHSAIYHYQNIVENEAIFNKELRNKIEIKKNEYRTKIRNNRERG